jgi:hypothetical protein
MKKPIILGKFLYLEIPTKEDSKIIVDENTKEELSKKLLKKLEKLKIWAIGDAANPKLIKAHNEGKFVLVNPDAIQKAKLVPFDEGGDEPVMRALVLDYDIIHIWP